MPKLASSLAAASRWLGGDEVDRRRFRANVIVEAEDGAPFGEEAWPGLRMRSARRLTALAAVVSGVLEWEGPAVLSS